MPLTWTDVADSSSLGPGVTAVHAWLDPVPIELLVARTLIGIRWAVRVCGVVLVIRSCDSIDEGKELARAHAIHLLRETLTRAQGSVPAHEALCDELVDKLGLRRRDPCDDKSNHEILSAIGRLVALALSFIAPSRQSAIAGASTLLLKVRSELASLPQDLFRSERDGALH